MQLEVNFFSAQPNMPPPREQQLLLCVTSRVQSLCCSTQQLPVVPALLDAAACGQAAACMAAWCSRSASADRPRLRTQLRCRCASCRHAGHIGLLVVDFDETCTAQDTIGSIIGAAVDARVRVCCDRCKCAHYWLCVLRAPVCPTPLPLCCC